MKLSEVKPAAEAFSLKDLGDALEEHGAEVSFSDFEDADSDSMTGSFTSMGSGAGGDIKITLAGKMLKVEVRGTDDDESEDDWSVPFKGRSAKDVAEDIDALVGRFSHDHMEDDMDDMGMDEDD